MFKSQPTDDKLSLIGAWSGHVTHYKILGPPIISLERLNLKSSNFVHECVEWPISILCNRMTYH